MATSDSDLLVVVLLFLLVLLHLVVVVPFLVALITVILGLIAIPSSNATVRISIFFHQPLDALLAPDRRLNPCQSTERLMILDRSWRTYAKRLENRPTQRFGTCMRRRDFLPSLVALLAFVEFRLDLLAVLDGR